MVMASNLVAQILSSLGAQDASGEIVNSPVNTERALIGPTRLTRLPTIRSGEEQENTRTRVLDKILGEAAEQSAIKQLLRSILGGGLGRPNFVETHTNERRVYRKGVPLSGGGPAEFDYY